MEAIEDRIFLDFASSANPPTIYATQGDRNSRKVIIETIQNGEPMNLEDTEAWGKVSISVQFLRPDGKLCKTDNIHKNKNIVSFLIPAIALNCAGMVKANVIIAGDTNVMLIGSQVFYIAVEFNPKYHNTGEIGKSIIGELNLSDFETTDANKQYLTYTEVDNG